MTYIEKLTLENIHKKTYPAFDFDVPVFVPEYDYNEIFEVISENFYFPLYNNIADYFMDNPM